MCHTDVLKDQRTIFRRCATLGSILMSCLLMTSATVASAAADDAPSGEQNEATKALHELFDSEWQRTLRENPTQASRLGDRRYNRLWDDVSDEAINASAAKTRGLWPRC